MSFYPFEPHPITRRGCVMILLSPTRWQVDHNVKFDLYVYPKLVYTCHVSGMAIIS
jgi:hypothetical protein